MYGGYSWFRSDEYQKLPGDQFSIENAIIMQKTDKWPLVIDPQDQCNQWIRTRERENRVCVLNCGECITLCQLVVLKITAPDFVQVLETAIRVGQW